ncbi:MAG: type II toxin-antitoxin system VapB family antitoxin [Bacteroidales bacterium]
MINQALVNKAMKKTGIAKKDEAVNFVLKRYLEEPIQKDSAKKRQSKRLTDDLLEKNISPAIRKLMKEHSVPFDPKDTGKTDEELLTQALEEQN